MQNGYEIHGQMVAAGYQGEWQDYQYPEQLTYPEHYLQQNVQEYDAVAGTIMPQDPRFMTQEDKDRGLGSVFKRDDQRLQQLREKDAREKDPNFISESYSECYPGYQEYNREVVDSDDEDDLSKMDMGGRVIIFIFYLPGFVSLLLFFFICLSNLVRNSEYFICVIAQAFPRSKRCMLLVCASLFFPWFQVDNDL